MAGSNAIGMLKSKMQAMRDELDTLRDEYDSKCREIEEERRKGEQVRLWTQPIPYACHHFHDFMLCTDTDSVTW